MLAPSGMLAPCLFMLSLGDHPSDQSSSGVHAQGDKPPNSPSKFIEEANEALWIHIPSEGDRTDNIYIYTRTL